MGELLGHLASVGTAPAPRGNAVFRRGADSPEVAAVDPGPILIELPTVEPAAPPPAGYRLYRDPAGWSVAVPKAWRAIRTGAALTFRDSDRTLRITHHGDPAEDPYAAQLQQEPTVRARIPGYGFLRIARVSYRTWPTADWEYRSGARPVMHTLVRRTVPTADQVYDISWTTQDRRWTADRTFSDTAARTFDPWA